MNNEIFYKDTFKINRGKFVVKLLPKQLKSTHNVSVRFNDEELLILGHQRYGYNRAEWLRMASLNHLPPVVPSINVDTWKMLGITAQQFNRVLSHLKSKSIGSDLTKTEIFYVNRLIKDLRMHLCNYPA